MGIKHKTVDGRIVAEGSIDEFAILKAREITEKFSNGKVETNLANLKHWFEHAIRCGFKFNFEKEDQMAITKLYSNWVNTGSDKQSYEVFTVGEKGVTQIQEHSAVGEGDKWYYDIYFADGTRLRTFNPNQVWINNQITGGENS